MEAYGIDWDGPLPQEPIDSTVDVPETQSVLSDQEIQIFLIPSLSVIDMELTCTCRLEPITSVNLGR